MAERYRANGFKAGRHGEGMPQYAEYGRLDQRVQTIESALSNVVSQMDRDRLHIDSQFNALQASISERSKIPWPALGVMLSAIVVIGTLTWYPIRETQGEIKDVLRTQQEKMVPRVEHEREWARNEKNMNSMLDLIQRNQQAIVPRGEHEEKWRSYAVAHTALEQRVEDVRRTVGDTYSLKDAIRSMTDRLDRIETGRLREANGGEKR
jgi:hypothetical protein